MSPPENKVNIGQITVVALEMYAQMDTADVHESGEVGSVYGMCKWLLAFN